MVLLGIDRCLGRAASITAACGSSACLEELKLQAEVRRLQAARGNGKPDDPSQKPAT